MKIYMCVHVCILILPFHSWYSYMCLCVYIHTHLHTFVHEPIPFSYVSVAWGQSIRSLIFTFNYLGLVSKCAQWEHLVFWKKCSGCSNKITATPIHNWWEWKHGQAPNIHSPQVKLLWLLPTLFLYHTMLSITTEYFSFPV